jgi:glutathione S-transferase
MTLQLYFRPMACSMATRIFFYEADVDATYTKVEKGMLRTEDGADYLAVNPMGQVPAVRLETGQVITENAIVLQYLADRFPESRLAPAYGTDQRWEMMRWLNFITTELHAGVFHPILTPSSPEGAKAFSYQMAPLRMARLEFHMKGRDWLLDDYSVADMYLYVILTWTQATNIKLSDYPALQAFVTRMRERPAVRRAFNEELPLYRAELEPAAA